MKDTERNVVMLTLDFPPQVGGMSRHCLNICRALSGGERLYVVAPGKGPRQKGPGFEVIRAGVPHERIFDNYSASVAAYFLKGLWLCLTRRAAFICCHTWSIAGVAALALKKTLGIPYVVFAHGLDINSGKESGRALWLMKKVLVNASMVLCNSGYTRGLAVEFVGEGKTAVLYPAIDTVPLLVPAVVPNEFTGKRVILSVGRLVESKGHDTVIRCLPALRENFPEARYCIVGTGPWEQPLRELARSCGVEDKVVFCGNVPDGKLAGYYQYCDVFVLASRELPGRPEVEGFGMVFLEAGACAKPVVATRCGGIPDAVLDGVTGILCAQDDVRGITAALCGLLGDPDFRHKLGENGKKRVMDEFNLDLFGKRLKGILEHAFDAKA